MQTNATTTNSSSNNGSVSRINIPTIFKSLYKTIWEIKQIWVLQQAKARGPFVDQSQSMNLYFEKIGNLHTFNLNSYLYL